MPLTFQTEALADVRDEAAPLLRRHWQEIALDRETVPLDPNWDAYAQIEAAGLMHITTARDETGALVGYSAYFIAPNLHYQSLVVAETDIFWLAPEHRQGLAGARLIKAAEAALAARGVNKVVSKVKMHFDTGPLFERLGYRAIERIYAKRLEG
ncbi:GNAT family N-acetyltransferase [Azospirillum doebereinerae]|uniref:GNAT family N-acetyltransferase n=1 Tax=Azospirillum doebereinerae TaxID=92933 RepID=UPI001EE58B08|nr:GNAT family N-acetyltransferase [Azospirillum doebereinerae]MCG5241398.1 GNAT family N-acetyltransferase [Azospirillum doebereinerae]